MATETKITKMDFNRQAPGNERNYAGVHLLAEFWGGRIIEEPKEAERILIESAKKSGNTPLEVSVHKFSPQGMTAVILLAESHIALHSWPELNYLAIDIFTCGEKTMPHKALDYFRTVFSPERIDVREIKRGALKGSPSEIKIPGDWHFDKNFESVDYLQEEGVKLGIELEKRILKTKSPYQTIEIIETKPYGRALILDGILQTTEKDEFLYHEMFVHPAMMCQKNPETALVVGGGDGGALREILKYPTIKKAFLAEIDKKVVELCEEHLPALNNGAFRDKRVEMVFGDGFDFVGKHRNSFDVVVVDSSDPIGPAESLFTKKFYKNLSLSLKKDGVVVIQAGVSSALRQNEVPNAVAKILEKLFKSVETRFVFIPSYNGLETFILASKKDLKGFGLKAIEKNFKRFDLKTKYYTPTAHFSSKSVLSF